MRARFIRRSPRQPASTTTWNRTVVSVKTLSFAALGTVSIPLFQGGSEYATIRQSKETLGQQRMNLDVAAR